MWKRFAAFTGALALAAGGLLGSLAGTASAAPVHRGIVYVQVFADTAHPAPVATMRGLVRGSNGTEQVASSTKDIFRFRQGKIYVTHHATHRVNKANDRTCAESMVETGTYTINKGTGSYRGLSGKGHYLAIFIGVAPRTRNGKCDFHASPKKFSQYIWAAGAGNI